MSLDVRVKLLVLVTLALSVTCVHVPLGAASPTRVLVLNAHGGKDASGNSNVDAIAALITKTSADLVLLQNVEPSSLDTLGTKLKYASSGAVDGIAALARGFIGYHTSFPLTQIPAGANGGGGGPVSSRAALAILATLRNGEYAAINTQFDPTDGRVGDQDLARIADAISAQKAAGRSFLVGGNFNATPDHPGFARLKALGLRDAWAECGSGDGFTYPSDKPAKRIDYLFLTGDLHCSAASVVETQISDHRPLLVTLK
jgi:endonuclease/exonuclease/phosphatase (EEP) superfamily protein YafD